MNCIYITYLLACIIGGIKQKISMNKWILLSIVVLCITIIIFVFFYLPTLIRTCEQRAQQQWVDKNQEISDIMSDCNGPGDPLCKKAKDEMKENDNQYAADKHKCQ